MTHEQRPERAFSTAYIQPWAASTPDPFNFIIVGRGEISFYKDGRVVADFADPDEAAKDFVRFIEHHYQGHIRDAEDRGAAACACRQQAIGDAP